MLAEFFEEGDTAQITLDLDPTSDPS